ncbi:hypothetical protein POTOM_060136 [Populus tomentosa]|uniref:Uncharacterized protein n=1 Tax=Populus tomentosa TaxID=118781 RepID=A0A8X7XV22_POPTO|nr:hypothetical protein POTOM_060136 [Populus tomentosa]
MYTKFGFFEWKFGYRQHFRCRNASSVDRKPLNIIHDMGRSRNASSAGESNTIALMLRDTEPCTGGVRAGKGFQVEVPDWSVPVIKYVILLILLILNP